MATTTSPVQTSVPSLAALFLERVKCSPDKEAFRHLDGGRWVSVSWRQTADRVEALAAGLLALGIEPEQRVGIASSTRLEWILADLAVMCAGAATTTVYANTNAADTAYILADSESPSGVRRKRRPAGEVDGAPRGPAQRQQGGDLRRHRRR